MGSAADSPRHSADADDGDNGSSKGRLVAHLWSFFGPFFAQRCVGGSQGFRRRAHNSVAGQERDCAAAGKEKRAGILSQCV